MNDSIKETLEYLRDYYLDWNDYIERFSFPRLDYYYLLVNSSSFYKMIDLAFNRLKNANDELDIYYVLKSVPKKIIFTDNIYNNFKIIKEALNYNDSVLEEYKENQKTN